MSSFSFSLARQLFFVERWKQSVNVLTSVNFGAYRNILLTSQNRGISHVSSGWLKLRAFLNILSASSTRPTFHLSSG